MNSVYGDTANLKANHVRQLQKLGQRSASPDHIIAPTLARDLLELSHELGRRLGLFVDRRGRVSRVILGDAHSIELPEFERVRGAVGRLRGIRLVVTHLVPEGLDREELADLSKLRLDLLAAVHRGPAGVSVDIAALAPGGKNAAQAFRTRTWTRTPLAVLARQADALEPDDESDATLPVPLVPFLRDLQAELEAATDRAREEVVGTKAMALMVHDGGRHTDARKAELRELCRTAGIALMELVEQRRPHPDPRTFFGSGKLRDVLVRALEQDVEVLICDPELSASQARTIAQQTDLKVIDRTMLILDIFAEHARSSDGKLQVELAQLRYNLPKMVGKGTMMSRLMGGVGGRGPGETKLEVDRRRARARIADLERRLKKMQQHRDQQRARRRRSQVPVVAIVGYTNAGKSTLLNTVTGSEVDAENKLFATLDPTVRRIRFPRDREIVLLDTVGFIRELPPALRQAFSATLEEVADADLLLHVVDVTDPDRDQHIDTVQTILGDLGAGGLARFIVYNKVDALTGPRPIPGDDVSPRGLPNAPTFFVSARDRTTVRSLMRAIEQHLWESGRVDEPPITEVPQAEDQAEDHSEERSDPDDDDAVLAELEALEALEASEADATVSQPATTSDDDDAEPSADGDDDTTEQTA